MTVIRVLPQGTAGAYGATNAATTALYTQALQNQKDTDSLKLQYQNALWEEKLQNTQLSTQLQYTQAGYGLGTGLGYGTGVVGASTLGAIPVAAGGYLGSALGAGSLGYGSGQGQVNYTNQTGQPGAVQTVTNSNVYTQPQMAPGAYSGYGYSGGYSSFGSGISNFFGNLFSGW